MKKLKLMLFIVIVISTPVAIVIGVHSLLGLFISSSLIKGLIMFTLGIPVGMFINVIANIKLS